MGCILDDAARGKASMIRTGRAAGGGDGLVLGGGLAAVVHQQLLLGCVEGLEETAAW